MRKLLVVFGVLAVTAFWAVPAFAETVAPATGYIEICKAASTTPGIAGASFGFAVPGAVAAADASVTVRAGQCSTPILVAGVAGADGTFQTTVTENSASWYAISGINVTTNYNGASGPVPTSTTTF